MVQRAAVVHICRVCGGGSSSKFALDEHAAHAHGAELEASRIDPEETPIRFRRTEDQMEFKPCLSKTPWGKELR